MKFIIDRITNKKETMEDVLYENSYSYGKININNNCDGCGICKNVCIVDAVSIKDNKAEIDSKKCIYCNNCISTCKIGAIEKTNNYKMAGDKLREKIYSKFNRSLVLRSVDTGSCNACMLELSAIQNTFYSISRYGINFAASPRYADGIVITGPVTINMKDAMLKTYHAMSEPRLVIALGACAHDGGIFKQGYGSFEELGKILPVDMVIPGCPPSPQAIIYGMLKLMDKI